MYKLESYWEKDMCVEHQEEKSRARKVSIHSQAVGFSSTILQRGLQQKQREKFPFQGQWAPRFQATSEAVWRGKGKFLWQRKQENFKCVVGLMGQNGRKDVLAFHLAYKTESALCEAASWQLWWL